MRCPRNVAGFAKNCRIVKYSNVKNFVLMLCNDCGKEWIKNDNKQKFSSISGLNFERVFGYMEKKSKNN